MNRTPIVLVVDDSEVERRLIGGLLERSREDYVVQYASDGREALDWIKQLQPDLVVTDLVMPGMDGLELLRAIRKRWPELPVVLLTAYGNERIAAEALEQGAASYIPKARRAAQLQDTVRRVLARVRATGRQERLMRCLTRMDCSFALENDLAVIASLVDLVQENLAGGTPTENGARVRIAVALEEALLNAFYHGNLEISEKEYQQAKEEGSLHELAEERRTEPSFRDRRIRVAVHISPAEVRFVVQDEGTGSPPGRTALTSDEARYFEAGRDRGLRLMRALMDEVQFNEAGNEVTLVKYGGRPVEVGS